MENEQHPHLNPDFYGRPVLDPSENVKASLKSEVQRLDDLIDSGFSGLGQKIEAEVRRIDEKIKIQFDSAALLNAAESKRLDAIRSVDINAVAVASERATAQASVLANQVVASAETLRNLVASTATTVAQQLSQLSAQLSDRISALEKSSYEGIGKGRVADPQMELLTSQVRNLIEAQQTSKGSGEGQSSLIGWIIGAAGFIATMVGIFSYFN